MEIKASLPPVSTPVPVRISAANEPPAAQALAAPPKDSIHISIGGRTNGQPAAQVRFVEPTSPQSQFGSAVRVDQKRVVEKRFLGMVEMTPNQQQQIRAAESKAFQRFSNPGNNIERGSLYAKIQQSNISHYQPGYLEHGNSSLGITDGEKDQVMDAIKEYGEDLGAIALTGRNRKDLQRFVEDKFFITLFDRDKEEFEDYFKDGFHDFVADRFGENTPDNDLQAKGSVGTDGLINTEGKPASQEEQYKWRFFRPRVGVSLKGLDFQEAKIKPKIDLVRLQGPALTEVRLVANVPFNFKGEYAPEAEIQARRIINHTPGEYGGLTDNLFVESTTVYNHNESQLRSSIGVRKQISPDASMGAYALYSVSLSGANKDDMGIGINYQSRFDTLFGDKSEKQPETKPINKDS